MRRGTNFQIAVMIVLTTPWLQGCADSSQSAKDPPAVQSQVNYLQSQITNSQSEVDNLQKRLDQLNNLQNDIDNIERQIGQIRQKTDNICFEDQMGVTVLRPCN